MIVYRITKQRRPDPLDPIGAKIAGGRFNLPGDGAIYCAETESLARLEALADVIASTTIRRLLHLIEVPNSDVEDVDNYGVTLPIEWDVIPALDASRKYGSLWLASRRALGLWVPSVQSRTERNLLLNPLHSRFAKVAVRETYTITFDPRHVGSGWGSNGG